MIKISCILPTARDDYPIIGLKDTYVLEPTFKSLDLQTFRDFELIIVDALYPEKWNWIEDKHGFPVKYIPIHPNHRFWIDRKRWGVCGQLNTALLYCEGELVVRLDDCCEFTDDYLQRFWDGYLKGTWPMAMHIRFLEGKPARLNKEYIEKGYEANYSINFEEDRIGTLKKIYGEDGLVRDSRYPIVKARGGKMIGPPDWFYGYSSMSLEAALKVNGFNELFDGDKGQEDQEMGLRLSMAGYKNLFSLDVNHQIIEHEHMPIPERVIDKDLKPIKCNYAIYQVNRNRQRWRVNWGVLTKEEIAFIQEESLKPPCSPRPNFYQDDCKGPLFDLWAENQPIFNLQEERMDL